ncbi:DNA double-strand break repair nuclease NurA [Stygiolobus caldivivus]|uniref:NurA domain-containing protein n=1 Tax=Stygiolobus caldivivus TaxID=2824673 RepID=A0A8D5ZJM4_9CREN|nr:DNA double-strand break repair nuclease NurA [Stygiolobus caldivivus]BCU70771.1 hypothetical protein KN1_20680 [Stygiolobus caldivivus]
MINDNGVLTTVITLPGIQNKQYSFKAIDGSFHELKTREGDSGYITLGIVKGKILDSAFVIDEINYDEAICVKCSPEEAMREMEYEEARKSRNEVDIILMDRKLSYDNLDVPDNVIAIVKDPSVVNVNVDKEEPWLIEAYSKGKIRGAYFKLVNISWVFLVETPSNLPWSEILYILYVLGTEPIPEALGYNYPLYLADKVAKYYRDKGSRILNFLNKNPSYRAFRSLMERNRRG